MNGKSNGLVDEPTPMSIDDQTEPKIPTDLIEGNLTGETSHEDQNQVCKSNRIGDEPCPMLIDNQTESEIPTDCNEESETCEKNHADKSEENKDPIKEEKNATDDKSNGQSHEPEIENNILTNNMDTENNDSDAHSLTVSIKNIINGEVEGNLKGESSDDLDTIQVTQEIVANNNNIKKSESKANSSCEIVESIEKKEDSLQSEKSINGTESTNGSDNESCHFIDDPEEDPISTGDNNEKVESDNEKQDSKDNEDGTKPGSFEIVAIKRYDSSYENSLDSIEEQGAHDTVSLSSGNSDDSSNDSGKCNDVIVIDSDKTDKKNGPPKSPEIHEIGSDVSDDCVVTAVEKIPKTPRGKKNVRTPSSTELRRSRRAVKRTQRYSDVQQIDESDDEIQEVQVGEGNTPHQQNWKAKNLKIIQNLASKTKKPKLTDSKTVQNNKSTASVCQSMAAKGIRITPKKVEARSTPVQTTPICNPVAPAPILPTLSDDMFVVEAPSFIVPYVYEKPASIEFKKFVDELGKNLEEERIKEAKEALERKIAEKAKRQQERQEKKDRGEEVEESEEELSPEELEKKKAEKAERRERRRRKKKEEDDVSWDGSSEESEDDDISDEDSQTKEPDIVEEVPPPVTDNYFNLSLAKFFMNVGTNLVQEYVQTDLLKEENRKLRRENRAGHDNKKRKASIAQLTKNLEISQKSNKPYKFEMKKCKLCSFKTESEIAMATHMETPHMKNNLYICNFCSHEPQNAHNILMHMHDKHGVKGRLERALPPHQCVNCPFEDHGKGKLARHLVACAKRFKPETNLAPPIDWEHPAKIPKLSKVRPVVMYNPVLAYGRTPTGSIVGTSIAVAPKIAPRPPTITAVRLPVLNAPMRPTQINVPKPVPRPVKAVQPISAANAKGVVMCEICDGYIKDLEQLRNHMQWIHRIKIHPKMIYNRPPLNCQKCQFKFFTDQGLERHLLGSHGLVTSAIQEAANKGKDAGRCPVCGRAYQRKLLAHVSRDHNMALKPAHLSYKCTVCSATFGMYRQFENHVYSSHSVVAKKAADKKATAAPKPNEATKEPPKPAEKNAQIIKPKT